MLNSVRQFVYSSNLYNNIKIKMAFILICNMVRSCRHTQIFSPIIHYNWLLLHASMHYLLICTLICQHIRSRTTFLIITFILPSQFYWQNIPLKLKRLQGPILVKKLTFANLFDIETKSPSQSEGISVKMWEHLKPYLNQIPNELIM